MAKWVSNQDANKNQLLNLLLQMIAGDHASPVEGLVWYDSTNKVFKLRTNTATLVLGRLDQISPPSAPVAMNGQKITGGADGTAATDFVTKQQLDAVVAGLDWKGSVRVATTAAGTLASSFAAGQVVDGVTLVTGDRILIKNQAAGAENGIYTVNASGAPTRATDFDSTADASPGAAIPVEEGTANGDTVWLHTTNQGLTLGTTALTFIRLAPAAASGMAKFSATIGDGAATSIAVNHNLGTQDVAVQVFQLSDGAEVVADVVRTNTNTVTLGFTVAPANNALRVVVVG